MDLIAIFRFFESFAPVQKDMSVGQIALFHNFKRKRPSEFSSSCSFSDIPKVSSQISL